MIEKRIVNVASYRRTDSLVKTLESIIDQCDEINVALNDFQGGLPPILYHNKVNLYFTDNSKGDAFKFLQLSNSEGYFLTIDDDLIYPPNYVDHLINKCKENNNSKVITLHGRNFNKFPINSYYKSATERYSCLNKVRNDVKVQFGGTGVMCFHTSLMKIPIDYFQNPNMADVWVGKYCIENNIEIICLKHDEGYVKYIPQKTTIYDVESKNDNEQTKIVNSIFTQNEVLINTIINNEKTIEVKIEQSLDLKKKEINYDKINAIFNSNNTSIRIKPKKETPPQPKLNSNSATISKMFSNNKRKIR